MGRQVQADTPVSEATGVSNGGHSPPLLNPPSLHFRYTVTVSGREALDRILRYLQLRPRDEVWITTTLGLRDLHITPCVTATIARHCRFSAEPGPRTAAVLVIHDYGVPHPRLVDVRERCFRHGWPLIEDAAHAFASTDSAGRRMGALADFALFSLPKYFAVSRGALATGLPAEAARADDEVTARCLQDLFSCTAAIAECRRQNWFSLDHLLNQVGLASALPLSTGSVPYVYVLGTARQFATSRRLRDEGIASGPDVHCDRLLLPCHQGVRPEDIRRMAAVIGSRGMSSSPMAPDQAQTPCAIGHLRPALRLTP